MIAGRYWEFDYCYRPQVGKPTLNLNPVVGSPVFVQAQTPAIVMSLETEIVVKVKQTAKGGDIASGRYRR